MPTSRSPRFPHSTMPCRSLSLGLRARRKRNAKNASQPCHFDLNWFLQGGLDAIDVTGISSRPRRKEKVQGWTPAFTLVILHRSADMLDTRHVGSFPTGLPKFRQRTRVGVILS